MYPPLEDDLYSYHHSARYRSFNPPPQTEDDVLMVIITAIQEISKNNMLFTAADIWPGNMDETPPIWPPKAGHIRKMYAFTQLYEEFPMATEVCLVRGTTELTIDSILVRKKWTGEGADRECWTPLKKWLL